MYAKLAPSRRPPFHVFSIATELYVPIAYLVTIMIYPPCSYNDYLAQPAIPTNDNMVEQLDHIECNVLKTVPTFLEKMVESNAVIDAVKEFDFVVRFIHVPTNVIDMFSCSVCLQTCGGGTYLLRSDK